MNAFSGLGEPDGLYSLEDLGIGPQPQSEHDSHAWHNSLQVALFRMVRASLGEDVAISSWGVEDGIVHYYLIKRE